MAKKRKTEYEHYTVGRWGDYALFQCKYCAYSTLDEDAMRAHYEATHKPPPPPRVVRVQRWDRFGNPVEPDKTGGD